MRSPLRPDLLIVSGDLVDGWAGEDLGPLLVQLERLRAPLGTFATWGNHDYIRLGDPSGFGRRLEQRGLTVLENRGALVRDDLFLAGIDDYGEGEPEPDMDAALAGLPEGVACLLIHGGQVNVPGIGPLLKASHYTQRLLRGWSRQRALGYISRGLGVSFLPIRLNCPPELTVLELSPGDGETAVS